MKRLLVFAYGVANYIVFVGVFVYLACFIGNLFVPRSMDGPAVEPIWSAAIVNTLLVALFGLQHSIMARPTFKQWWTRFVPEPMERSTYVLFTNLALIVLFWQWRPMGGVIWDVTNPTGRTVLYVLYAAGWLMVFVATCLINHFDLFGLRQVWMYLRGEPYTYLNFRTPGPYRFVRHPLYVGWLMAFWATPTMTAAHFLFAMTMTLYILIAIRFEERNLVQYHGQAYEDYRQRVPMLIPCLSGKGMSGEIVGEPASST